MTRTLTKISGIMASWVLGVALIAPQTAHGEAQETQSPQLNRTDLTPAALQEASALIEKYLQPIAEPAPTVRQKRAIESAIDLLKSEQAMKGQTAIERFVQIGPAALGDLRRLAASAPPENSTGMSPTADVYTTTMAAIIIRRIETAQRQPIVQELISLGDVARAVLSLKIEENDVATTAAESRIEAATAALIKASNGGVVDAPAVAGERKELMEAQAAGDQLRARRGKLVEIKRLMAAMPSAPQSPSFAEEQPQQTIPPANVLQIQPISPPTVQWPYTETPDIWPYNSPPAQATNNAGVPPPPLIYVPPVVMTTPNASH